MKVLKGWNYLVKVSFLSLNGDTKRAWYMVHQTGQRSWSATLFSQPVDYTVMSLPLHFTGNSQNILPQLEEYDYQGDAFVYSIAVGAKQQWRKAMFDILGTGEISGENL